MDDRETMSRAGMGLGADQMTKLTTRMHQPGPKKTMALCSLVSGSTLRVAVSFRRENALKLCFLSSFQGRPWLSSCCFYSLFPCLLDQLLYTAPREEGKRGNKDASAYILAFI